MLYWHKKRLERREMIRRIIVEAAGLALASAAVSASIIGVLAIWVVFGY